MPEEKKVRIVMDRRDPPEIAGALREMGAEVELQQLHVADFICSDRVAVERKTRTDFERSVIDQRLFDQLSRLRESYSSVILIVEGPRNPDEEMISRAALLGAYSSVLSSYGASIFFTLSPEATAEMVLALAKYEQLSQKRPLRVSGRPKGITFSQNQRAIVEMLPMVGPKLADQLLRKFGSVKKVFSASEKRLMKVEKLGEKKAKAIRRAIDEKYEPEE